MSNRHKPARARVWLAAVSVLALSACATQGGFPTAPVANPTELGFTAQGLAALDAAMERSVAAGDVAGAVTLLARDGQIATFETYGVRKGAEPMTEDTLFRIYSMTKPVTGVALMMLYEDGRFTLDDPITKHLPELAGLKLMTGVDAEGKPILGDPSRPPTMRELMAHTAGFGYGLAGSDPVNTAFRDKGVLVSKDLDEMMDKIAEIPLLYDPGTRWFYSISVDIQGYIVQKMSGQRFGEFLKTRIFDPLGMDDTSFVVTEEDRARFADVYTWNAEAGRLEVLPDRTDRASYFDPARIESGGGGLVSTTRDYALFCQMLLNGGELGGKRLLKPETVALMTQNHIGDLRLYSDGTAANPGLAGVGFGLDFAVVTDPTQTAAPYGLGTYYWGGAAGTWFWIDPVNDLFFIGMIQRMQGARPGGMDFRTESAKLVYQALAE